LLLCPSDERPTSRIGTFYLGRGDHINVDSWARTLVGKELGRPVTDAEEHTFFAEYVPWRGLAYSFYGWRT
jgi:hypothetical protein